MALWWYDGFDSYTMKELKESMALKYKDIMEMTIEKFKQFAKDQEKGQSLDELASDYYTILPASLKPGEDGTEPEVYTSVEFEGKPFTVPEGTGTYTLPMGWKNKTESLKLASNPYWKPKKVMFKGNTISWDLETSNNTEPNDLSYSDIYVPEPPLLEVNEATLKAIGSCLGKTIKLIQVEPNLTIYFTDDVMLTMWDDNWQCCEKRWLHSDDNPADLVGATLMDIQMEEGVDDEGEVHIVESQFIRILTDKAPFVVTAYNQHTGAYAGIVVKAKVSQGMRP